MARLAAIIENTDDAIVSKDLDGIIRTWNAGAERIFGWRAAEAIGRPINIIIPPERQEEEASILARLRRGERVDHFETVRLTKDGRRIDVSVTISPIRDRSGAVVAASKIARDITEQKQARLQLQAAKQEAERANRVKDRFLSVLSHELRTPLTPALARLSFLEESGAVPESLRGDLAAIRHNIEMEARLVDDLLDVTRIRHGKLRLRPEDLDLHVCVRTAVTTMQPQIAAKSIRLQVRLDARRHRVRADPGRVQQILLNLLANAVKFTPAGAGVEVSSNNPAGSSAVRLCVRDEGAGIEPDLVPRLFERFEQGGSEGTVPGGLGLGLSIARDLAEMHGGALEAESAGRNLGSTFTLTLPTLPHSRAADATRGRKDRTPGGLRVLLVEDHADTREAMILLLGALGCRVRATGSVREAIEAGERETFDLLLSDLALPDGSGAKVMKRLHSRGLRGVALTGFGQDEAVTLSQAAGFERHITKPVTFQRLRELLAAFGGPD